MRDSKFRRGLLLGLPLALLVALGVQAPAFAGPAKPFTPAGAAKVPSVKTKSVPAGKPVKDTTKKAQDNPAPVWPGASATDMDPAAVKVAGGPVTITAPTTTRQARTIGAASVPIPGKVHVEVLDQQASK
ncbi:hypothetical protein, partial [Dactylosporangium sp. NPDC049140]|uniref:hypothetical protein n=1 Tax=Dactylosporangium sp. NPDC049140 TaxID=3155647 RepID=UPI0033C7B592